MPFWCYILKRGGVFHTGHTDDPEARMARHGAGPPGGFTAQYAPCQPVWSQEYVTRSEALEAERQIKGWSRAQKLALIRGDLGAVSVLAGSEGAPRGPAAPSPATSPRRTEGKQIRVAADVPICILARAHAAHPHECCGILLGSPSHIEAAIPARNVHPAPATHFEIDPQALIDAHRAARAGGPAIAGYYHSHPTGDPAPSATDAALAAHDGAVWAIAGGGAVRFWRDDPAGFAAVAAIIDPADAPEREQG